MDNYVFVNGQKFELTKEQVRLLGFEVPERHFDRAEPRRIYYYISETGAVKSAYEIEDCFNKQCFDTANYCTDKGMLEQRALHETLSRLLWRFSEQNGGNGQYSIAKTDSGNFRVLICNNKYLDPTFTDTETAKRAITEIIEPFMADHPDFVW